MAEEIKNAPKPQPPQPCERFDAACKAMEAAKSQENYIKIFEALELDTKENRAAFVPLSKEDAEAMQKGEGLKFAVIKADQGPLLVVCTTQEQAKKRGQPVVAGMPLALFFKALLSNPDFVGFAVNPGENSGLLLDRRNLEVLFRKIGGMGPQLAPQMFKPVVDKLVSCAVGMPEFICRETQKDIEALGGPNALLKKIMEKWQKAIKEKTYAPRSPDIYVKDVVKDAMSTAFVAGVLVRRDPNMVKDADTEKCIERVPYLKEDLAQNTDQYLVFLSDAVRRAFQGIPDNQLWVVLANNIGLVAMEAMHFGFDWGVSKYLEQVETK